MKMKTWLTKFRISNALDEPRKLPPLVEHDIARSAELKGFANGVMALDEELKNTKPVQAAPESLHAAILFAMRSAEANAKRGQTENWPKLIPVSALGAVIVMGLLAGRVVSHSPIQAAGDNGAPSLALASSTLETGGKLVQTMPGAVLSPLSDEMARLNRDLTNAQNYLLASVP